ncbi:MAG: hypothetical protein IKL55_00720 [Clostridia bacterium]|nr:hypothetical protein [Clostridia bacterium]
MTGKEVYKIWAPFECKWADWVRPVPFVQIDDEDFKIYRNGNFDIPKINYLNELKEDTAIIVDLPEHYSINEGIALSRLGYRPIPVFNGTAQTKGARATVDNHAVESGLIFGGIELQKIELKQDAPPVFLTDSNRLNRYKLDISIFDNSWDLYHQDLPSAEYFLKNGIDKVIVRGNKFNKDLKKILYRHQEKGMKIYFTEGYEEPKEVKLKQIKEAKN